MQPIDSFFIITNIETIRNSDVVQALKRTKNNIGMVVLDECHKCKNPNSQQGHNLLKLNHFERKIGLTGTLIVNKPIDSFTALK
jgi:superfamily II DNA or RNA helicase